ncbi:hypothetical protein BS17DRAFT_778583 [Gyrodon lividus]|nr:hypothetical protein BS17DRAFT_778583 [Gyrodon lividus]
MFSPDTATRLSQNGKCRHSLYALVDDVALRMRRILTIMVKQGLIFNTEEAQGADHVQQDTTAVNARAEAPTSQVAQQVAKNAEKAKDAAEKAAQAAKDMGPEMTGQPLSDLDILKRESAEKMNAAVVEGQHDIQTAKEAGACYFYQAKSVASNVLTSAQDFLRGSTRGQSHLEGSSTGIAAPESIKTEGKKPDDVPAPPQPTAQSVIGTTGQYIASAQAIVQPHVESAREALEPHIAGVKAAVQPHVDKAQGTVQEHLGMGNQTEDEPKCSENPKLNPRRLVA